jgi:hypothetical protein
MYDHHHHQNNNRVLMLGMDPGTPPGDMIIVGILIGLIIFLTLLLARVALPPLMAWIRRKLPVSPKRIERRYATIDGWLISKRVQPHDGCCVLLMHQLCDDTKLYCETCRDDPNPPPPIPPGRKSYKRNFCSHAHSVKCTLTSTEMLQKLASVHWKKEDLVALKDGKNKSSISSNSSETEKTKATSSSTLSASSSEAGSSDDEESIQVQPTKDLDDRDSDTSEVSSDDDDDDDDERMNKSCGICLEKFRIGEAISWSCYEECGHVFHHECLREWLLKKVGCPYCRTRMLPIDRPLTRQQQLNRQEQRKPPKRRGGKFLREELNEMASIRAKFLTRSYFCIEEGLILLRELEDPPPKKNTTPETNTADSKAQAPSSPSRRMQFWNNKRGTSSSQQTNDASFSQDDHDGNSKGEDRSATCRTAHLSTQQTVDSDSLSSDDDYTSGDDDEVTSSEEDDEDGSASYAYDGNYDCSRCAATRDPEGPINTQMTNKEEEDDTTTGDYDESYRTKASHTSGYTTSRDIEEGGAASVISKSALTCDDERAILEYSERSLEEDEDEEVGLETV